MMDGKLLIFLLMCFVLFYVPPTKCDYRNILRLTKIECEFINNIMFNDSCKIKAISRIRTAIYIDMFLKRPSDKVILNMQIFKKNTVQYLPYIVNTTFNACKLITGAKQSFIAKFMKEWIQPHSNFNHPCPYTGHVYIKRLEPFADNIPVLVAAGDYRVNMNVYEKSLKNWVGTVRGYGTITMKPFVAEKVD